MKNLLFVNACVRQESRTKKLCDEFFEALSKKLEFSKTELDLQKSGLNPLTEDFLNYRKSASAKKDFSDSRFDTAKLFNASEILVIGAPYWDLSFPASLKVFVENICVDQLTFKYTDKPMPEQLGKTRALVYITTAGGYIGNYDCGCDYMKAMCDFFHIKDKFFVKADGLDIFGNDVEQRLQTAREQIPIVAEKLALLF